jgi:acyl transferase domain-containing protein
MYANRVSFVFDFKGPSMAIDTACSSSMVALDVAVTDLRTSKAFS